MLKSLNIHVNIFLKCQNTTYDYLASKCGISQPFLSLVLNGDKKMPENLFMNLITVLELSTEDRFKISTLFLKSRTPETYKVVASLVKEKANRMSEEIKSIANQLA